MREAKGKREENKEEGNKWEGEDEGEKQLIPSTQSEEMNKMVMQNIAFAD